MKVTVDSIESTRKKLVISIPGDEIAQSEETLLKEFTGQVRLPGFRPGKAPAALVRKRFAKEIREELKRKMMEEAFDKATSESGLEIYTVLDLKGDEFKPGEDAELMITVDVFPEVTLPEYKQIRMEVPSAAVSDEEVESAINHLREQRADYDVVERPAQQGDYVRCGYTGKVDGELVETLVPDNPLYATQKSTWEEAGSEDPRGVKAVVDALVGMKAGDTREASMTFPDDFAVESLRGKAAIYEISVEEVREKVLPELNETFLEGLQVDSVDTLKERVREDIANQKQRANRNRQIEQLQDTLLARVEFDLPASAVEQQTEELLRDFVENSMRQGMPREELESRREELFEGATKAANQRVKLRFLLGKIAETEKIQLDNDDLSNAVMQEAMATRTPVDKLVKDLKKDRNRLQSIRENALLSKVLDQLVEWGETVEIEETQNEESPQS